MKALHCLLLTALLFGALVPSAVAQESVSMDFFYDNLDPYGTWREVGDYGYCWQPRDVADDWRPYSEGRWVYTDAGWTWDSDEPYGWAGEHRSLKTHLRCPRIEELIYRWFRVI